MRPYVAVIGPTNAERVGGAAGIALARYQSAAEEIGRMLAEEGFGLVVVPDRGVAVWAMDGYLDAGGAELVGLCPSSGVSEPAGGAAIAAQRQRCHRIVDDLSWYEQHARIGSMTEAMVAVGLSCGTVAELVWTKWTRVPRLAIVADTISGLPPEIAAEIEVDMVSIDEVRGWLTRFDQADAA